MLKVLVLVHSYICYSVKCMCIYFHQCACIIHLFKIFWSERFRIFRHINISDLLSSKYSVWCLMHLSIQVYTSCGAKLLCIVWELYAVYHFLSDMLELIHANSWWIRDRFSLMIILLNNIIHYSCELSWNFQKNMNCAI